MKSAKATQRCRINTLGTQTRTKRVPVITKTGSDYAASAQPPSVS